MLDETSLELLKRTKMTEKESQVYLAALQLGTATVAEIAKLADLKRSITYVIIDSLIHRGYMELVSQEKKQRYAAIDPNTLASELEQLTNDFREMLPYLRSLQRKTAKPQVTYYTGIEGARQAYSQIRKPKEARYAVSIETAQARVPDEVKRWQSIYLKGKARAGGRHLLTNSAADHSYGEVLVQAKQIVRYLEQNQSLAIDLALVDDTVYLTSFEAEILVTVIKSPALYRSLATLYDLAWSASETTG